MEKRLIVAFILSFAVLYGFQTLFSPRQPDPAVPAPAEQLTPNSAPATLPPVATPATSSSAIPKAESPGGAPLPETRAETEEDFPIENALYTATVSNVGGTLRSFTLKAYTDGEGRALELIHPMIGARVGWPLALVTGDPALDQTLAAAPFAGRPEGNRVSLEFSSGGVHAKKTFQFDPLKFEFSMETSLTKDGKSIAHSVVWQGDFGDQSIPRVPLQRNAVYQENAAWERVNVDSIEADQPAITSPRIGVEDQYFLAMFLSPDLPLGVRLKRQEYSVEGTDPIGTVHVAAAIPEGKAIRVYVGPKSRPQLSRVDPQLEGVIDYGWFAVVARPLVAGLLWLHSYIGNFGWAIIILTIAINVILFPLRLKQQVSMLKMQKIQPQMRRLQDQYKKLKPNDPRRPQVQSEMMGLYKQHGVNPMGGCLPLVLQMPVLFGFYSALYYSIELRRAPWLLWIKDLSQHDPYYVLPILMALSMLVMTKLTPSTVDPMQAKMMMIMPLMFAVMFIYQSSGLVLYWLTSNVAGIGQQVFINKYWTPQADKKLQARNKAKELPEK